MVEVLVNVLFQSPVALAVVGDRDAFGWVGWVRYEGWGTRGGVWRGDNREGR